MLDKNLVNISCLWKVWHCASTFALQNVEPGQQGPAWFHSTGRVCPSAALCLLAQQWRCPPSMKGFKPSRIIVSCGYQHSLDILLNKREHRLFMHLRSPQESQRGRCKMAKCRLCQIQGQTPSGFNGISYLSLDFKAEADYWTSCLKLPWATTVQLITPKSAHEPQQWSPAPRVPGPHNSEWEEQESSLPIASGLCFYLQGHKQWCVLCDKDTCLSWMEGYWSQRLPLGSRLVLLWMFQVAKSPYTPSEVHSAVNCSHPRAFMGSVAFSFPLAALGSMWFGY